MTEFGLEVMNYIDPALVEEVALRPRRLTPRLRATLIAACLCLALVGTGMAAVANGWIRLSELTSRQINRRDGTMLSGSEYMEEGLRTVKEVLDAFA